MGDNHNLIEHVYVINPLDVNVVGGNISISNINVGGISIVSSIPLDVNVLNSCISICNFPSVQQVSVINPCISICEPVDVDVLNYSSLISLTSVTPLNVSIINPCISICDIIPVGVSVTNPISITFPTNTCISICNSEINPLPVTNIPNGIDLAGLQQWDADFVDGNDSLLWDTSLTGAGTATDVTVEAARSLNTTTASGDVVIVQGRQRQLYLLGRSKRIIVGALLGAKKTNVTKRIGFFDTDDGLLFEQTGTTLSVVTRTSASGAPVDTATPQASWNLDPLDGTGPSGITLDETKINFYIIEYDYHGAGRVKFGFRIGGNIVYVHAEDFGNIITLPFIARCTLPVRISINNTGVVASSTSLKIYSASIINFSGNAVLHLTRSVDLGTGGKVVGTTLTPLISIRLKSAFVKNLIRGNRINIFTGSGNTIRWALLFNPTSLTAPTWTSVASNSIAEFDTVATAVTGGTQIASGYFDNNNGVLLAAENDGLLLISSNIAGTSDFVTLAAQRSAGTAEIHAAIMFEEFKR